MIGCHCEDSIEDYISSLTESVCGRRSRPPRIILEARLQLLEEAEGLMQLGHSASEACSIAITRFGSVPEIAPSYRATLACDAERQSVNIVVGALLVNSVFWHTTMGAGFPPSPELAVVRLLTVVSFLGIAWGAAGRWRARMTERRGLRPVDSVRTNAHLAGAAAAVVLGLTALLLSLEPNVQGFLTAAVLVGAPFSCALSMAVRCRRYASGTWPTSSSGCPAAQTR